MNHNLRNDVLNPHEHNSGEIKATIPPNQEFNKGDGVFIFTQQPDPFIVKKIVERRPAKGEWKDERKDYIHFQI